MRVLSVRNVAEAYRVGLDHLSSEGFYEDSRNGRVLVSGQPVTTVYARPTERVLIDARRDANPFFHVMESVWMLAGSRDGRWLDRYVRDFSSRFAEEDGQIHGAYGYRWRQHFDMEGGGFDPDQLLTIGEMMMRDPGSRRAVLTMWDPVSDLGASKKDLPCNTHVYVRSIPDFIDSGWLMDLTVLCRSNDIVWGAYGANAVHMSIMGEVLAGLCGMKFGTYRQVSNNYHAYERIIGTLGDWRRPNRVIYPGYRPLPIIHPGSREEMADEAMTVLMDCAKMVQHIGAGIYGQDDYASEWMRTVAYPIARAHNAYRNKDTRVYEYIDQIQSPDWREACRDWMLRRNIAQLTESHHADT